MALYNTLCYTTWRTLVGSTLMLSLLSLFRFCHELAFWGVKFVSAMKHLLQKIVADVGSGRRSIPQ